MTDVWSSAVFLGLVTLLVFGLGVPAYLLTMSLTDDVRLVLARRRILAEWPLLSLAVAYTAAIVLVLLVFSRPNEQLTSEGLLPWVVRLLVLLCVVGTILMWWRQTTRSVLVYLVNRIERGATDDARSNGGSREAVDDLIILGCSCHRLGDVAAVIAALDRQTSQLQGSTSYEGSGLDAIVGGVLRISEVNDRLGNDQAIALGSNLLRRAVERATTNGFGECHDVVVCRTALAEFATVALRRGDENRALKILEAVRTGGLAQLAILRTAIATRRWQVAAHSLQRLRDESEEDTRINLAAAFIAGVAVCASGCRGLEEIADRLWATRRGLDDERSASGMARLFFTERLDFDIVEAIDHKWPIAPNPAE